MRFSSKAEPGAIVVSYTCTDGASNIITKDILLLVQVDGKVLMVTEDDRATGRLLTRPTNSTLKTVLLQSKVLKCVYPSMQPKEIALELI